MDFFHSFEHKLELYRRFINLSKILRRCNEGRGLLLFYADIRKILEIKDVGFLVTIRGTLLKYNPLHKFV